jgi:ATP-dependent helicase/nuclease subunit A
MSLRKPNSEQEKAIQHTGGVLLNAGAGSGKTFVLVEHVIYLLEEFSKNHSEMDILEYELQVRNYLSQIVLMTFTNKAAGELNIRLVERIEAQLDLGENVERWEAAKKSLDVMTVGTIHGFCHKLLSNGYVPEFEAGIEIISEVDLKYKVERLLNNWFCEVKEKGRLTKDHIFYSLSSNYQSLLNSLVKIFSDSDIRLMWRDLDMEKFIKNDSTDYFIKYIEESSFAKVLNSSITSESYKEFKDKPWAQMLSEFNSLMKNSRLDTVKGYEDMLALFAKYNRKHGPDVKKNPELEEIREYFDHVKLLGKFLKDNSKSFLAYFQNFNKYLEWNKVFQELVDYVEENYQEIPGYIFSDLEYYLMRALEDTSVVDRISKSYKYFIVDEFQDTSHIQFSIIRALIQEDFNKLFCVGDMKQAIYGFRGGELDVFRECMDKVQSVLPMKNNYRSKKWIIEYNNHFFKNIFPKHKGFTGHDKHAVDVLFQECPLIDPKNAGSIVKTTVNILETVEVDKPSKLSSSEMNYYESVMILERLKNLEGQQTCILYKKLAPTKFLIPLLLKEQIGFTAQIKVPRTEDPVVGIFVVILEAYLQMKDTQEREYLKDRALKNFTLKIGNYLKYMGVGNEVLTEQWLEDFRRDLLVMGLFQSFKKLLFSFGFANSNHVNNISLIEVVCNLAYDDPCRILEIIQTDGDETYSIDFRYGNNSDNVLIMTTHASKGLEFENIILGGMHTNGSTKTDAIYFGKIPGSCCWKEHSSQKVSHKSPQYLYEQLVTGNKDFSESKRLFYVAATRAEKSLQWFDLNHVGGAVKYGDDSWINGSRSFESAYPGESKELMDHIKKYHQVIDLDRISDEGHISSLSNVRPLFHQDSLGIEPFISLNSNASSFGLVSELSVTRLGSIVECPRKFYLQNICKISELQSLLEVELNQSFLDEKIIREDVEIEEMESDVLQGIKIVSSADRGTALHDEISRAINDNFQLTKSIKEKNDLDSLKWGISELKKLKDDFSFISEVPLKFPFFGFTVSGTPDLILYGKNANTSSSLWDFKTGKRKLDKEKTYWFQLFAYAYGLFQLGKFRKGEEIDLVLAYLDEKALVKEKITSSIVQERLWEEWEKLKDLSQVNHSHCASCQFGNMCHL